MIRCAPENGRGGLPPPPTPESTEEEDSSTGGVDFSEFEVVTGASPPSAQRGACVEASTMTLGERRLAPATLIVMPAVRAVQGSPTPASGRRSPASTTGQRSPTPAAGRDSPTPVTV